jgi:hypothetical protein
MSLVYFVIVSFLGIAIIAIALIARRCGVAAVVVRCLPQRSGINFAMTFRIELQ